MPENDNDAKLMPLESALRALVPRSAQIDRDRLMFQAGRHSGERRQWIVPVASAVLASAATLLTGLVLYDPEPRIVEVFVQPEQKSSQPGSILATTDDHWRDQVNGLRLRNDVLEHGIEALTSPSQPDKIDPPLNLDTLF